MTTRKKFLTRYITVNTYITVNPRPDLSRLGSPADLLRYEFLRPDGLGGTEI